MARAKPSKIVDTLATKSLQGRRGLDDEHKKSLKSFEPNNSIFVANETQKALNKNINNPVLNESLDGDLDRFRNQFPKLRKS